MNVYVKYVHVYISISICRYVDISLFHSQMHSSDSCKITLPFKSSKNSWSPNWHPSRHHKDGNEILSMFSIFQYYWRSKTYKIKYLKSTIYTNKILKFNRCGEGTCDYQKGRKNQNKLDVCWEFLRQDRLDIWETTLFFNLIWPQGWILSLLDYYISITFPLSCKLHHDLQKA